MQMLARSAPFRRGKCCPFFPFCVFCVWSGVFCRFLPFFSSKGRFLKKFSGANFCFWVVVLVLCFLVGFCLCFCFFFGGLLPKVSEKILLMSGLVFFGGLFSLLWFFRRRRFFFLKRHRSGSNRTPPHTHLFCLFLFSFCVRRVCSLPVLAVRPASWRFFGVPFWAPCVFGILLELVLRPFFLDARRQGFSCASLALLFFFPLLFCLAATHFFSPSRWSRRSGQRVISPAPRPSEGEGSASSAEGWSPPFLGFCRLFW